MILTLEVIGEQAEDLGAASRKVFNAIGGTIGRLPDNDWVFPDPYVSGRHALIRYLNGKYFIEDTSTNGVFINSPDNRLSRTQPQQLRNGDLLFIDAYQIRVSIEKDPAAARRNDPVRATCKSGEAGASAHGRGARRAGEDRTEPAWRCAVAEEDQTTDWSARRHPTSTAPMVRLERDVARQFEARRRAGVADPTGALRAASPAAHVRRRARAPPAAHPPGSAAAARAAAADTRCRGRASAAPCCGCRHRRTRADERGGADARRGAAHRRRRSDGGAARPRAHERRAAHARHQRSRPRTTIRSSSRRTSTTRSTTCW